MKVFYFGSNSLLLQKGFWKIFVHGERLQGSSPNNNEKILKKQMLSIF